MDLPIRMLGRVVWAGLLLAVVGCAANNDNGRIIYGSSQKLGVLQNTEITESSGLAASRRLPGVFWTHNDSGNPPDLYAINELGHDLAVCTIDGVENRDWEDMASFELDGAAYLLIGDVGDNERKRADCELVVVREPAIDPTQRGQELTVEPEAVMRFVYPDGAHDCEAVAVDADEAAVYLVTKAPLVCRVYRLPFRLTAEEALTAELVTEMILPFVTAMDISPDGERAVLATYGDAQEFVRWPDHSWADAFAAAGRIISLPSRTQGESICFNREGQGLYLTSEKTPTPLYHIPGEPTPQEVQP